MQFPWLQKNCEFRPGALDSRYPNLVQVGQDEELRIAPGRDTAPGFFCREASRMSDGVWAALRGMGKRCEEFIRSRPVISLLLTGKRAAPPYSRSSRNGVPS
jgi:hypothetical protein